MTRLGCGAKLLEICLICFNLIFLILGTTILALGVYILVDPKFTFLKNLLEFDLANASTLSGNNLSYIDKCCIAFIVLGSIMFLISFMGCCGAYKQARVLLVIYSLILLIVLLTEIGFGVFALVYSSKLKALVAPTLTESIKNEYYGEMQNKTLVSNAWDVIMYNFECCGVTNSSDFNQIGNVWTWRNNSIVPKACCMYPNHTNNWTSSIPNSQYYPQCVTSPNANISNFRNGCYDKITSNVNHFSKIIIGSAIGVTLTMTLGVIFALCLSKMIKNSRDYV